MRYTTCEQITELSTSHHQTTALDAVSQLDPDSISSRNSDEDCAIGVHEQVAGPSHMRPDAASEHAAASLQTLHPRVAISSVTFEHNAHQGHAIH